MPVNDGEVVSTTLHLTSISISGAVMKKAHFWTAVWAFMARVPFSRLELKSVHTVQVESNVESPDRNLRHIDRTRVDGGLVETAADLAEGGHRGPGAVVADEALLEGEQGRVVADRVDCLGGGAQCLACPLAGGLGLDFAALEGGGGLGLRVDETGRGHGQDLTNKARFMFTIFLYGKQFGYREDDGCLERHGDRVGRVGVLMPPNCRSLAFIPPLTLL